MPEMRTVQLPEDLCASAEKRFRGAFGSLQEFLIFILQDLSRDEVSKADEAEQRLVEDRLKELGYL